MITYTSSSEDQEFPGAERIVASLDGVAGDAASVLAAIRQVPAEVADDRR